MENFTDLDWGVFSASVVAIITFMFAALKAIKGIGEPVIKVITSLFNKKDEDDESLIEKLNIENKKEILTDQLAQWQVKIPLLEGNSLQIAKDRIAEIKSKL